MKDDRAFERATSEWLEGGSDRTPKRALDAVVFAVRSTPQDRVLRSPWGSRTMPAFMRIAAAIAIVAVAGVTLLTVATPGARPGVGGVVVATASPSPRQAVPPSATASPLLPPVDTSAWTPYVSERYAFSIAHPPAWDANPSERDWDLAVDTEVRQPTPAAERFESTTNPDGLGIWVAVWSVRVTPGTTAPAWIAAYCPPERSGCATVSAPVAATMDGHAGTMMFFASSTQAFFLVGDRVYVVACWRAETDAAVAGFGGARRLVEAFTSTMRLPPAGPSAAPRSSPPG